MNTLYRLVAVVCLLLSAIFASIAQFTFRPTAAPVAFMDSVRINHTIAPTPDSLNVHTDAYERYARKMRFKYRNKVAFNGTLDIGQTAFDNWAAGGSNSFSGRIWSKFTHTYTNEQKNFKVISDIDGAYTLVIADGVATKSEDYLNMSSTPSWKIFERFEISGSAIIKTQFANSYTTTDDTKTLSSTFFAPANITLSAGVTYTTKDGNFSWFMAPLSGNAVVVANDQLAALGVGGVEAGKHTKAEFGLFNRVIFKRTFLKEAANFSTQVDSFWNYKDCPTLWWESRLSYKFTQIFGMSLYLKVLYDQSIVTPRFEENNFWQINQSLGFNLTYTFKSPDNSGPLAY